MFAHTSIDGFMGGPKGELDWILHDEEVDNDFIPAMIRTADTILSGRATYESFEAFWPERAANPDQAYTPRASGQSPAERDLAQWMVTTPMVVFTNTVDSFEMSNARRAERDIAAEVNALKTEPGKDMVIFGGASTVQTLVAEGLIDEYWLKQTPVAVGAGLPIFSKLTDKQPLTLTWSKAYDSGIVGLRYAATR